ncbi:MAG: SAM-dependent methyltransferase [Ruminococcus sp.]|nr:SAM-dependent methyltransferase [Ruminococcus sp.]MBQ2470921.1 SAM-dependent methyltransferase [Ruminococcus sp.]
MSQLDSRLALCASFVREGKRLADIGTDHAYLPVWLCRAGVTPCAVAADINPDPLRRGTETVANAGLSDRIETRLSDGLKNIASEEAEDIVIAGMGGELIARILDECPYSRDKSKRFILQPMTKSEVLVRALDENGFSILRQDCCVAADKCYTVLNVAYTGETAKHDALYPYLGELRPKENAAHLRFVEGHISRLQKQAKGDARFAALAEELKKRCE